LIKAFVRVHFDSLCERLYPAALTNAAGGVMRAFIVAFLLLASTAYAQDGSGVTTEAPRHQENDDWNADNAKRDSSFSVPVRVVDEPEDAQRARDREGASDKHDSDDLKAQQKAADAADRAATAAERQIEVAWWQLGIGVVALLVTIWQTRRAMRAIIGESAKRRCGPI
jgi:hypothetical protein